MKIDEAEVLRLMGCEGAEEASLLAIVREASAELLSVIEPAYTARNFKLLIEGESLSFGKMTLKSKALCDFLQGCEELVLFAATLGAGADRLLYRAQRENMGKALVLDACAAAAVESYCDECCEKIARREEERGLFTTQRFSPGYADFDISFQRTLLNALNASRTVGLSLTEGLMLVPQKSVTAVIGLSRTRRCSSFGCSECKKEDCGLRRSLRRE